MNQVDTNRKRFCWLAKLSLLMVLFTGLLTGCSPDNGGIFPENDAENSQIYSSSAANEYAGLSEGKSYATKEEVAEYLHVFGELPPNYLTKREAEALGWDNSKGNLWEVAEGMSIGGDRFGNREGLLPVKKGRQYYEADIDYAGGYRNGKRIVYSNDGLIFYTDDHYASFEQLDGEEEDR